MRILKTAFCALLIILPLFLVYVSAGLAIEDVTSMPCDQGPVSIGDTEAAVFSTCGEPSSRNYEMHQWKYVFGPSEPVYVLTFDNGKVVRIQVDEWGS